MFFEKEKRKRDNLHTPTRNTKKQSQQKKNKYIKIVKFVKLNDTGPFEIYIFKKYIYSMDQCKNGKTNKTKSN